MRYNPILHGSPGQWDRDRSNWKGGGGTTQTVQKADPWSGVQPYLTDYLQRSQAQSNTPFQFNSGDQIAPLSPEQQYGLAMSTQRAINGSPVNLAAQNNATNTLNGDFMSPDSNPYLKGTFDTIAGDITSRVNSQFGNSNFGSSAHQELLTRNLGSAANDLYGQNYQAERSRQMQTMGMAPALAETDYRDAQALMGVGDVRRGLAQDYLNQGNGLYNNYIGYPQQQLDRYANAVSVGMGAGGTTTSTAPNPNQSSPIAGAIGGGMAGYSLGGAVGGAANGATFGPWGAAIGAGLGLLMS
jgi:hypothetical protein